MEFSIKKPLLVDEQTQIATVDVQKLVEMERKGENLEAGSPLLAVQQQWREQWLELLPHLQHMDTMYQKVSNQTARFQHLYYELTELQILAI